MKLIAYGVRPIEEEFFHKLNTQNYHLTFVQELLTDENVSLAKGHDGVILRGNCKADRNNLQRFKAMGIRYLLTRTVGTDHIDLAAANDLNFQLCAYVPAYSPNAISELAVSLALGLLRKTFSMITSTSQKDFIAYDHYFAKEIRHCTVGIIGVGRIGLRTAKAFTGLDAEVIGYDPFVTNSPIPLVNLETLLQKSDIVLLHSPYIKDQNHHMVNREFINMMKQDAILVNTARGELVHNEALLEAVESNKLSGVALDVIEGERAYFFKKVATISDPIIAKLHSYYPRVILTPHLGSFTDEALTNMIEISYQNLEEFLKTGQCSNSIF